MANKKQLEILRKGGQNWNRWVRDQPRRVWDLRDSDLRRTDLRFAALSNADLEGANLDEVDLRWSDLGFANLHSASLNGSDLRWSNLKRAHIVQANLNRANLSHSNLESADLYKGSLIQACFSRAALNRANLSQTDLTAALFFEADLREANLSHAKLDSTDLTNSQMGGTVLGDNDLRTTLGLRSIFHVFRSTLGVDTLYQSQGDIPDLFLRGVGLPDTLITYLPSLVERPIQFFSCFISYSHVDVIFARRIYNALNARGIHCWLDEHQLLPGDKLYTEVDRGIRTSDKVLLCCTRDSLTSWWVDNEIKIAFDKEQKLWRERGEEILAVIPLNIDGYLFSSEWKSGLATEMKARLAADFTKWDRDVDSFTYQLERLVKALKTDGGKEPPPLSLL